MPTRGIAAVPDGDPFEIPFKEKSITSHGVDWKFRELSVAENDACIDAAKKEDGTIDGRVNIRMMIAKSSVEPKITVDKLAKMPNGMYLTFAEFVSDLNSGDDSVPDEEDPSKES